MRTSTLIGLAAALTTRVYAACSSATKIDDFSKWSSNVNTLGEWTSGKWTPLRVVNLCLITLQMMAP
jgi:hypothetical protein